MKLFRFVVMMFLIVVSKFVLGGTGFTGTHASTAWTFYQDAGGNGTRTFTSTMLTLKGSNALSFMLKETKVTMVAPLSGTYSFSWQHTTLDNALYEDAAYYINTFYNSITEGNAAVSATGTISFYATAGSTIGFAIFSNDDAYGASTLKITNFTWPDAVTGCMDASACNYVATANIAATCVYPATYYKCNGACVNDSDGDGVCNELEILGCQISGACNYNANATDPGNCILPLTGYNCAGQCIVDTDGDGVCNMFEVPGCSNV
ncbi:MAG: hypothetical protein RL062_259, partial [Bacteroidota bacterium]